MGWRDDYWGGYYPPSRPRQAKGGIKARSQRGQFGTSWWAKRWIDVLHGFPIGARLDRGRSYARRGQVLNIEIAKGVVRAQVQGSRPTPYKITIKVQTLGESDWKKVTRRLADQALFAAKLLAGEMPQDIEQVFKDSGVSLFPSRANDLSTDCSCPDWSNPCKHIAAVYFLLGEEFDRDPFLIFTLRGLTREELFEQLERAGVCSGRSTPEAALPGGAAETRAALAPREPQPLASDPATFWRGQDLGDAPCGEVAAPPGRRGLAQAAGQFSLLAGDDPLLERDRTRLHRRLTARARGLLQPLAASPHPVGHDERRAVGPGQELVGVGVADERLGGGVEGQFPAQSVIQTVERQAVGLEVLLHAGERLVPLSAP